MGVLTIAAKNHESNHLLKADKDEEISLFKAVLKI